MLEFNSANIIGENIDETYFKLMLSIASHGRKYEITDGSMKGDIRLELDVVSGTILKPITYLDSGEKASLAVTVPQGCPVPTTDKKIFEYFNNYLLDNKLAPNEHYKYASWITGGKYKIPVLNEIIQVNNLDYSSGMESISAITKNKEVNIPDQLSWCINHYARYENGKFNFGNNHCVIKVGYPESSLAYDISYETEIDRGTSPCLQLIDTKIIEENDKHFLCFYVVFRSWDGFAGWPENMGGLILLQEYMANSIEIKTGIPINVGPISFYSKGIHIYGSYLDALKMKVGSSVFESKE